MKAVCDGYIDRLHMYIHAYVRTYVYIRMYIYIRMYDRVCKLPPFEFDSMPLEVVP